MAQKCVNKGCGKVFTDPDENCIHHPEGPIFHEGQKGWKCCKPRVLTFDEFLSIPPCTTGKHSTVVKEPPPSENPPATTSDRSHTPAYKPISTGVADTADIKPAISAPQDVKVPPPPRSPPESESDDPSLTIPPNLTCRRRGCHASSPAEQNNSNSSSRETEICIHHPGQPVFHEGSKGWSCCKRRVLDFDEFMRIEGCRRKNKHLFIGKGKKEPKEEVLANVRHDFYQTPTNVIASLYLKNIDKKKAQVGFPSPATVSLDLPTTDQKIYKTTLPLYGLIDSAKSTYKIMSTKLELNLCKADGSSWPVLGKHDPRTNEILQVGQAGRA